MNKNNFKNWSGEGMAAIPEKFLRKLDNVAIVIEDEPTPAQKKN